MDLRKLASEVAEVYKQNPKVEAVLLGGSVSRNWHDEHSDIELFIFWKSEPNEEDRKNPIVRLNGSIIDFHPYEEEEWAETFVTQGVKLEISGFLTDTINKTIDDVLLYHETDLNKQCIVATVQDGVALHGETVINQMKEKVKEYPDELRIALVEENIFLGNRWSNRAALLDRKDWLMLYKVIVDVQTKLMSLLFGLNRQYVHHPAFKWQKQTLHSMELTPSNISNRLASIFLNSPEASIRELEVIIEEMYDIIEQELPQIDLSFVRNKALFLRPKH